MAWGSARDYCPLLESRSSGGCVEMVVVRLGKDVEDEDKILVCYHQQLSGTNWADATLQKQIDGIEAWALQINTTSQFGTCSISTATLAVLFDNERKRKLPKKLGCCFPFSFAITCRAQWTIGYPWPCILRYELHTSVLLDAVHLFLCHGTVVVQLAEESQTGGKRRHCLLSLCPTPHSRTHTYTWVSTNKSSGCWPVEVLFGAKQRDFFLSLSHERKLGLHSLRKMRLCVV